MNTQERELLTGFLQELQQANANPKDPEAEALIREALSRQPDAGYLLVQRALGLNLALTAAQTEITKLQAQRDPAPASAGSSFLGNQAAWGKSAPASNSPDPRLSRAAAAPAASAQPSTWGSGMMTNIATTAAGVVAGSFLYQGMQSMMGHHKTDPVAANDKGSLTDDEIAATLEADDSIAAGDNGSDSSDIG